MDNSRKIADLKAKVSRLTDLYVDSLITMEDYAKRKDVFLKEIESLQKREAEPPKADLGWILQFDFDEIYKSFSPEEKRMFWRKLVDKIIVYDDWTIRPVYIE